LYLVIWKQLTFLDTDSTRPGPARVAGRESGVPDGPLVPLLPSTFPADPLHAEQNVQR